MTITVGSSKWPCAFLQVRACGKQRAVYLLVLRLRDTTGREHSTGKEQIRKHAVTEACQKAPTGFSSSPTTFLFWIIKLPLVRWKSLFNLFASSHEYWGHSITQLPKCVSSLESWVSRFSFSMGEELLHVKISYCRNHLKSRGPINAMCDSGVERRNRSNSLRSAYSYLPSAGTKGMHPYTWLRFLFSMVSNHCFGQ